MKNTLKIYFCSLPSFGTINIQKIHIFWYFKHIFLKYKKNAGQMKYRKKIWLKYMYIENTPEKIYIKYIFGAKKYTKKCFENIL